MTPRQILESTGPMCENAEAAVARRELYALALATGNKIVIELERITERYSVTIRPARQSTRCSRCGGTGYPHGREWVVCTACGGSGRIE